MQTEKRHTIQIKEGAYIKLKELGKSLKMSTTKTIEFLVGVHIKDIELSPD